MHRPVLQWQHLPVAPHPLPRCPGVSVEQQRKISDVKTWRTCLCRLGHSPGTCARRRGGGKVKQRWCISQPVKRRSGALSCSFSRRVPVPVPARSRLPVLSRGLRDRMQAEWGGSALSFSLRPPSSPPSHSFLPAFVLLSLFFLRFLSRHLGFFLFLLLTLNSSAVY